MSYPTDLSDLEWEFIRKSFENNNLRGRPSKHSRREIVNAARYVLRTGTQRVSSNVNF
jgi:transposase